MTLYIGDIPIHYVSSFNVDRGLKNIEEVHFIGSDVVPYLAEHNSKLLDLEISGTLLAESGVSATLDDLAERILAIKDRGACFNFIHNFQSRSGWAGLKEGASDKNAHSLVTRPFNMEGKFLPKNSYQPRMHSHPIILTNDFSLSLGVDGCDNYIPIPVGATYSGGDGSAITRVGKDGTTTLVKATTNNDIKWDLDADEVDVGECKVWDDMNEVSESDWVRVFNPDHVFTGKVVVENGLIRIFLNNDTDAWNTGFDFKIYANSTWQNISIRDLALTLSGGSPVITNMTPYSISPDKVIITAINGSSVKTEFVMMRGKYVLDIYGTALYANQTIACGFPGSGHDLGFNESSVGDDLMSILLTSPLSSRNYIATWEKSGVLIALQIQTDTEALSKNVSDEYFNGLSLLTGIEKYYGSFGAIPFTCANLFKECEDMTQGAGVAFYTGVDASPTTGNTGSILDALDEDVYYEFTGGTDLPLGTYKLFVRAKDSAQVADDLGVYIHNYGDGTPVFAWETVTLTGSWAYYAFDVTIASDDNGDSLTLYLRKKTATANTIDLDYILWVPISLDSGNGPQDIAHQAMVDQRMQRELIQR